MRSGKNKLGDYLEKHLEDNSYVVSTDMFAKDLKSQCNEDFANLGDVLNRKADEIHSLVNVFFSHHLTDHHVYLDEINRVIDDLKISRNNWYEKKTDITRTLLQTYGEDIFRNRVDLEYWANKLKNRCLTSLSDCVIVTDTRHPNEIDVFDELSHKDLKVVVIKVERSGIVGSNHQSENSMTDYKSYDYIVENNGTLKDLEDSAKEILKDLDFLSRK